MELFKLWFKQKMYYFFRLLNKIIAHIRQSLKCPGNIQVFTSQHGCCSNTGAYIKCFMHNNKLLNFGLQIRNMAFSIKWHVPVQYRLSNPQTKMRCRAVTAAGLDRHVPKRTFRTRQNGLRQEHWLLLKMPAVPEKKGWGLDAVLKPED